MGPANVALEGNFLVEAFHLGTLWGPSLNSIEMLGKFLCRELGPFFHGCGVHRVDLVNPTLTASAR
jgi:hypothetical protein